MMKARINLEEVRNRLAAGESITKIASDVGTTRQNIYLHKRNFEKAGKLPKNNGDNGGHSMDIFEMVVSAIEFYKNERPRLITENKELRQKLELLGVQEKKWKKLEDLQTRAKLALQQGEIKPNFTEHIDGAPFNLIPEFNIISLN